MKSWIALLALAALPSAGAEPDASQQTDTIVQASTDVLFVVQRVQWVFSDGDAYDGLAHFYGAAGATNVSVSLMTDQGLTRTIPPGDVQPQPGGADGFTLYRVELKTVQPTVANASYSLNIVYQIPTTETRLRSYYDLPSLVIYAAPQRDFMPTSETLERLIPIQPQFYHAIPGAVPANYTYHIAFVYSPAPAASASMTTYVWGAGGLLVGVIGTVVAIRQGWVTATVKAKKFEKGGAMEARTMLEARRRTLLAALKDLEQAHEAKEVPDDAYFPLKEEYKQQTVRVMRTLEEKKG